MGRCLDTSFVFRFPFPKEAACLCFSRGDHVFNFLSVPPFGHRVFQFLSVLSFSTSCIPLTRDGGSKGSIF